MSTVYYSEHGEDKWIDENLHLPAKGIYLDIGCGHPEVHNNTAFLRDRGWVGVSADGNDAYWRHWVGRQQFSQALFAAESPVRFQIFPENSAMSRLVTDENSLVTDENIEVRSAVTLEYFLGCTFKSASPKIEGIDYMSIDLEGAEFEVFQTFDWKTWRPRIIVAEYATLQLDGTVKEDFRLRDLLLDSGLYLLRNQNPSNIIYTLK